MSVRGVREARVMIGFSIGVNFASATGGGCGLGCALKKTGKSEVRCFCCTSTVDGYISAPVVFPVLFSSCRVSPRPFALRVPRTWNSHVNWYCRSSSTWLEDERARGEVENHPVVVWRLFHGHFLALVSFVDAKEVVTRLLCGGRGRGRRSQLSSVELMWQRCVSALENLRCGWSMLRLRVCRLCRGCW